MNKSELLTKVQNKVGFKAIIEDVVALDSPTTNETNKIEKRFLKVATVNSDGTAGITFVFYLIDTNTQEAWFYNTETEALDIKEPIAEQKKVDALQNYLKANFDAFFLLRWDVVNNWAEADTYELVTGTPNTLKPQKVIVYKKGANPIAHLKIT